MNSQKWTHCALIAVLACSSVLALHHWRQLNLEASSRQLQAMYICQNLNLATEASFSNLKGYIDSADPFFLHYHDAAFKSANQTLSELKQFSGTDMQTVDLIRVSQQMLKRDAELLKETIHGKNSYDSVSIWKQYHSALAMEAAADLNVLSQKAASDKWVWNGYNETLIVSSGVVTISIAIAFARGRCSASGAQFASLIGYCKKLTSELNPEERSTATLAESSPESLKQAIDQLNSVAQSCKRNEKSIIDNAVDMICWLDAFGKFQKVSASCLKITGYTEAELIGTRLLDHIPLNEIEKSTFLLHTASLSADLSTWESWFRTKSGDTICLRWSAHWSAAESALFSIAHDITERKQAEELLAAKEAELRILFEALPAGVVVLDDNERVIFWNSALSFMLGHTDAQEMSTVTLSEFLPDFKVDSTRIEMYMQEDSACKKRGERFPVQLSVAPLSGGNRTLLVISDVSAMHAVETMKREFIAMISHDLKTPLTSIRAFIELLFYAKDPLPRNRIEAMAAEVDRLMRLIQDLLDMEKMRAGKFDVYQTEIDLKGVIVSAIAAVENLAHMRKIAIVQSDTSAKCYADGARTIQVLVNLLSNALKFSPKRSQIEVGVIDSASNEVVVYVRDQGRGVPSEMHQLIFEKYAQAQPSDATEQRGTGLGLHICKLIIEQQGGKIWVESAPAAGSTFYFSLPVSSDNQLE